MVPPADKMQLFKNYLYWRIFGMYWEVEKRGREAKTK
jgi:hypothetical protein